MRECLRCPAQSQAASRYKRQPRGTLRLYSTVHPKHHLADILTAPSYPSSYIFPSTETEMSAPIVAIAGANSKLATLIANHLLENYPEVKIHGIARSPEKVDAAIRDSPNVEIFEASASDTNAIRQGLRGAEVALCCYLGNNELMTEGQKTLIDACIDEKVARYVASDWAFDYRGLKLGDHPSKDPMIHINTYLEEKEKSGKIKAVHVLNGAFMEVVLGPFNPFFQPKVQLYQYWGTGDEAMEMTSYADAAVFTAEVAADPSAVGFLNGELHFQSLPITANGYSSPWRQDNRETSCRSV